MDYGRKERILIVDDEEAVLNLQKKQLELLGFDCDTEPDGLRAMLRTKGARYDLVLLDINLPFISGTDLLKGFKKADHNMPVVMISGLDSSEIVRKALRGGAYDFLTKPVNSDELELTVKRALEHGRLLRKTVEYRKDLEREVEERTRELRDALEHIRETYDATILALGSALETRDIETQAHALRVAQYSMCLAKKVGISDSGHLTDI
ncbi:response regulator, partial [bacterium]|nr:response regulator [bacterium]